MTRLFDKRSKFVHYLPEVAIINNLEFDHADILKISIRIQTSFKHFIRLIPRNGLLLRMATTQSSALAEHHALSGETLRPWGGQCRPSI